MISADRKQKQKSKSLTSAQPTECNTPEDTLKTQSSQEKERILWSTPEKTTHSEKPPTKMISEDKNQKSKSSTSTSVQGRPAQSKSLKAYRRYVSGIREPQEVKTKRPQTSMKFFKKFSSSKSQVSISDEEIMSRSGVGDRDHATKLQEIYIAVIGTRPPHSTGRELIAPTIGGIEARNDESSERDKGDKNVRQKEKRDSADSLRQPRRSTLSNSKSASTIRFQGFAGKAGLITNPVQYSRRTSKVTKKGGVSDPLALASIASADESAELAAGPVNRKPFLIHSRSASSPVDRKPSLIPSRSRSSSVSRPPTKKMSRPSLSNAPTVLSMEWMDEWVKDFLPFGIPQPRPTLLSQPRVKRKPALAQSTRPKPANEKPPGHPVLFKDGVKASRQSKVLQGPAQDVKKVEFAPNASPQPQADYKESDKPSATNTQSPSFSMDAHLATSTEGATPVALEENSQSLVEQESTEPKPSPQNPLDEKTQSHVYSGTTDTFKTGKISDPATALREAATEATVRNQLNLTSNSVGGGAICHVRVTLGSLSGVFTSRDPSISNGYPKDRDNSLVVGYAEMVTLASEVDSSIKSANSIPITPQMGDGGKALFKIEWASRKKGDPKTRNRLYFSVAAEPQGGKFEQSLIRVGVRRGEQKIPLGLISVQVGGNAREREKFDLALQPIEPRRRKAFFWDGELDTSKYSFCDDDLINGLSDSGRLRVRIDVKKGIFENSGPVLWRDVIRKDELVVRSPASFFEASLRGSYVTMKDDTCEISYSSKAPGNVDDEQIRFLEEVSECDERNTEKKNCPLSEMEKTVPLPFVEKASYTLGGEKRFKGVTEERDNFIERFQILGSQNELRDGVSKSELRSSIVTLRDEMGKSLQETSSHGGFRPTRRTQRNVARVVEDPIPRVLW